MSKTSSDCRTPFDVLIVGAGPAGMFAARRLLERSPGLRVAMIDKGRPARSRSPLRPLAECAPWQGHDLIAGAGGAGLYSDGKLTLTLNAGGKLGDAISDACAREYVEYIDQALLALDGVSVVKNFDRQAKEFGEHANREGLLYKHLPIRHFGTEALKHVVTSFFDALDKYPRFQAFFGQRAVDLTIERDLFALHTVSAEVIHEPLFGRHVIFAVGKEGSPWLVELLRRHSVAARGNRMYVGVRVEAPHAVAATESSFDPKLSWTFEDGCKIKTHCFCRRGQILPLYYFGLPLAGSHMPFTERQDRVVLPQNSVFGVLLGDTPARRLRFDDALEIMHTVDGLTGGRLLVQRYGDFLLRKPTTEAALQANSIQPSAVAVAGDVSALNLPLEFNVRFAEFMRRLGKIDPNTSSEDALVYAPAIEWWMPRVETNADLETLVPRLYTIGDGAGLSQGITYSAATGIIAADAVLRKI